MSGVRVDKYAYDCCSIQKRLITNMLFFDSILKPPDFAF